jgi:hypothetical protein
VAIGVGLNGPLAGFGGLTVSGKTALTGSTFIVVTTAAINGTTVVLSDNYNSASSYQLAQSVTWTFGNITLYLYYLINGSGSGPSGTNHTISLSGTSASALFCEFTGVGAGSLDAAPAGTSSGNSQVSSLVAPTPTTTVSGELVISAACPYGQSTALTDSGSGFSIAVAGTPGYAGNGSSALSWAVVSTAGTAAGDTFNASTADYLGALTITIKPASGGGVTETLTGQAITSTEGTITRALSYGVTGQAIASTLGTITPTITYPVTGRSITSTEGALTDTVSYGLAGQSITSTEGALTYGVSYGVTGQSITSTEGNISATTGGNVTDTLTGQAITSSIGTITSTVSYSVSGLSVVSTEGTVTPTLGFSLTGLALNSSEGTVTPSESGPVTKTLTGQNIAISLGTITVTNSGAAVFIPPTVSAWTADSSLVTFDSINFTCDGADLVNGGGTSIPRNHRISNTAAIPILPTGVYKGGT